MCAKSCKRCKIIYSKWMFNLFSMEILYFSLTDLFDHQAKRKSENAITLLTKPDLMPVLEREKSASNG